MDGLGVLIVLVIVVYFVQRCDRVRPSAAELPAQQQPSGGDDQADERRAVLHHHRAHVGSLELRR
jgi:hypothetical protein